MKGVNCVKLIKSIHLTKNKSALHFNFSYCDTTFFHNKKISGVSSIKKNSSTPCKNVAMFLIFR